MRNLFRALPLLLCLSAAPALAQNVPLTGGTYVQDFDTLSNTAGSTTNATLPAGWLLTESGGGSRDNEQYAVGTGSSNTGDSYSFGADGSSDRALGGLRSGSLNPTFGACFTNQTGRVLTSLPVAYTGEQWRLGTAGRVDRLVFEYSTDATSLTSGTWTSVAALEFSSPNTSTAIGLKVGNAAENRTARSATITGLSIANGGSFCFRWTDEDASGADDGLAIDDFSLTIAGGSGAPALVVDDVSITEGNAGSATATFTVSLSAPAAAGGVSFDIATADGTATAGSDYAARALTGQMIPAGASSYTFAVTVNGDGLMEPDETFFVNVANVVGATVSDGQGVGTILNDDLTTIAAVQGSGTTSPFAGQAVAVEGIVTAIKFNNGFFLQTADGETDADPATSEGIFVYTGSAPAVAVGQRVRVGGTVTEFTPGTNPNQRPITEIVSPTVTVLASNQPLPAAITLTTADFSPAATVDTAERLEGMRVHVASGRVVGPSDGNITETTASSSTDGVFHIRWRACRGRSGRGGSACWT